MVELQLFPSDASYLQLLPGFFAPAFKLHLLTSDQGPFCCCTLICVCCKASLSLLIIAAFADEATANLSAVVGLLLPGYYSCAGPATATADVAAARLAFCCWA